MAQIQPRVQPPPESPVFLLLLPSTTYSSPLLPINEISGCLRPQHHLSGTEQRESGGESDGITGPGSPGVVRKMEVQRAEREMGGKELAGGGNRSREKVVAQSRGVRCSILPAVDGAHLHSESRQLLPSLARRAPAQAAAVPVAFGYSCAGEPASDGQPTATSSGPGVNPQGNLASSSCTRWKPDDSLAGFWHLWLLNYREAPSRSLNSRIVWLPCSLVALFILSSKEAL
ncbi:unnamed protein product [Pleuronectes platessa]|uniref:Uncharacterized protein n=1 Tax=Pleuronectes platessa TaxID=8262 RepID=A0A9N7VW16_PLEPL|nr:unnamed protein product [Pleuronectes platessa]